MVRISRNAALLTAVVCFATAPPADAFLGFFSAVAGPIVSLVNPNAHRGIGFDAGSEAARALAPHLDSLGREAAVALADGLRNMRIEGGLDDKTRATLLESADKVLESAVKVGGSVEKAAAELRAGITQLGNSGERAMAAFQKSSELVTQAAELVINVFVATGLVVLLGVGFAAHRGMLPGGQGHALDFVGVGLVLLSLVASAYAAVQPAALPRLQASFALCFVVGVTLLALPSALQLWANRGDAAIVPRTFPVSLKWTVGGLALLAVLWAVGVGLGRLERENHALALDVSRLELAIAQLKTGAGHDFTPRTQVLQVEPWKTVSLVNFGSPNAMVSARCAHYLARRTSHSM